MKLAWLALIFAGGFGVYRVRDRIGDAARAGRRWLLWSPWRLAAGVAGVVVALVVVGVVTGGPGSEPAPAAVQSVETSPETFRGSTPSRTYTNTTVPSSAAPTVAAEVAVAEEFTRRWINTNQPTAAWLAALQPYSTPLQYAWLEATDPANVPIGAVTGPGQVVRVQNGTTTVLIPTDQFGLYVNVIGGRVSSLDIEQ